MPSIPLIFVWFAVLSGYMPYSMGYSFLNPLILIGYGLLGWLIGANVPRVWVAISAGIATTLLALLVVHLVSGNLQIVMPATGILISNLALTITSVLATSGLRRRWLKQGMEESRIQLILRGIFVVMAIPLYANGYFPIDWKIWLAEHTTDPDLVQFAAAVSLVFLGLWRIPAGRAPASPIQSN